MTSTSCFLRPTLEMSAKLVECHNYCIDTPKKRSFILILQFGDFEVNINKALIKNFDDVKDVIGSRSAQIIDTRRHKHFMGEVEEPTDREINWIYSQDSFLFCCVSFCVLLSCRHNPSPRCHEATSAQEDDSWPHPRIQKLALWIDSGSRYWTHAYQRGAYWMWVCDGMVSLNLSAFTNHYFCILSIRGSWHQAEQTHHCYFIYWVLQLHCGSGSPHLWQGGLCHLLCECLLELPPDYLVKCRVGCALRVHSLRKHITRKPVSSTSCCECFLVLFIGILDWVGSKSRWRWTNPFSSEEICGWINPVSLHCPG